MRSKICFIIPEYNTATPTHFNYMRDLIRGASKDFNIFLVAEKGSGRPDFIDEKYFYIQKFRFAPLRFLENLILFIRLRLMGYDNFYIHYSFLSAFNASIIARVSNARTFYWNCGLPWQYKRNFLRYLFERTVYKLITFLVTGTEGLKKEYGSHYSLPLSKIKIFPNWIDLNNFKINRDVSEKIRKEIDPSGSNKILLFVHRLSKRKGADYLPDILNELRNENIVLIVIGDGPERKNIESGMRNYELWNKVKFLGNIPNKNIADYFGAADIFIMPSEEEGFPHVILESMAAGVPFVAFSVGGVREISPLNYKYLVSEKNLDDFIKKTRGLLLEDEIGIKKVKETELDWVKRFDLSFAVEKFKEILEKRIDF